MQNGVPSLEVVFSSMFVHTSPTISFGFITLCLLISTRAIVRLYDDVDLRRDFTLQDTANERFPEVLVSDTTKKIHLTVLYVCFHNVSQLLTKIGERCIELNGI